MNTVELLQYSLGCAFDVFEQVTADLTQEQIDWQPPGVASSIGSIYSHLVTYLDFFVHEMCIGQKYEGFQEPAPPPEIMMQDVQADLGALHERAKKVRVVTEDWLASLAPPDLDVELVSSVGPLNVGQMVEAYIIWHINVHCGEISALKGCQGAKGYPW